MPELTEQEKLERRRQKRQQRILASADSRLSRITGTAYPLRASPTPSPSTSASSLAPSEQAQPPSRSPSPAVFGSTSTDTLRSRKAKVSTSSSSAPVSINATHATARFLDEDPSEELGAPPPLQHDEPPSLFAMLDPSLHQQQQQQQQPADINLNDLFQGQFPFNPALLASLQGNTEQEQEDTTTKYWNLLHFVSMLWLGIYAVYTEWHKGGYERFASLLTTNPAQITQYPSVQFPLFWYFVTLELMMQSARMMYQQGPTSRRSMLSGIIQQLPPQIANVANIGLRYWLIFSFLIKDCLVLVFVIGFAELLSTYLVN
ncbi:hypothetical protein BCR43DRAFT_469581 [Syncephalastrum racemosum]|uniref:Golgi to ER traffic protein 2 n=1 Tax=Syncephalastrum racemosum TaxID=13706 RepID=A0A1X2HNZ1_SYNRA|nr:hypothetical protein BCR43DRAFT_469581 [Syncephalastrum racemosum]